MSVATRESAALPRRRSLPAGAGWIALGALALVAFAGLLYLGRSTTFYFDEWDWVQGRREWDAAALLEPHNEHLSLVPVLVFKLLFSTVGTDSYVPYRVAGLLLHCGVTALLFAYARKRVGELVALGAAAVVLFLGTGWPDMLWPFQIGFLSSLAAGIGALLALDREDRRGNVLAAVLLGVALASSSLGLPLLVAFALEVLGRPDRRSRWWIVAAPAAVYALWYVAYGGEGTVTSDNVFGAPGYVADAAAGAAGALFSLDMNWGRTLAVAGIVALLASLHRRGTASWRRLALIAAPLAFWGLTAIARGQFGEPAAPRYLYPGVVFLLLIAVEAAAGIRLSRGALVVAALLVGFAVLGNAGKMREGAGFLRDESTALNGALAALPLVAERVTPDFQPDPGTAPQIRAGAYLDATRDLGSNAPSPKALPGLYERARARADESLRRALTPRLVPAVTVGDTAPDVEGSKAASVARRGGCQALTTTGGTATADVVVPRGGLVLRSRTAPVRITLRRFSDGFGGQPITAAAGGAALWLQLPSDASPVPWRAQLTFAGSLRACSVG